MKELQMDPLLMYLSSRVLTALAKNDLFRVEQLAERPRSRILDLKRIGTRTGNEIISLLKDLELNPGDPVDHVPVFEGMQQDMVEWLVDNRHVPWKREGVDIFKRATLREGHLENQEFQCSFEYENRVISVSADGEDSMLQCSCSNRNCKNHALAALYLLVERRRRNQLPVPDLNPSHSFHQPLTWDPLFYMIGSQGREKLREAGLLWIEEIAEKTGDQIKEIDGIGRSRFREIDRMVQRSNLSFGRAPASINLSPAERFPPDFGKSLLELRRNTRSLRKGIRYFQQENVRRLERNPNHYSATVRARSEHEMTVNLEEQSYECSCGLDYGNHPCAHVVATALSAARRKRLEILSDTDQESVGDDLAWMMETHSSDDPGSKAGKKAGPERAGNQDLRGFLFQKNGHWQLRIAENGPSQPDGSFPPEKKKRNLPREPEEFGTPRDRAIARFYQSNYLNQPGEKRQLVLGELISLLEFRPLFIERTEGEEVVEVKKHQTSTEPVLEMKRTEDGGCQLQLYFDLGEERIPGEQTTLISKRPPWLLYRSKLYQSIRDPLVIGLLERSGNPVLHIREDDIDVFQEKILPGMIERDLSVEPADPPVESISISPEPRLTLSERNEQLRVRVTFAYRNVPFHRVSDGTFYLPDPDQNRLVEVKRNSDSEQSYVDQLRETGLKHMDDTRDLLLTPAGKKNRWLIEELPELRERDFEISGENSLTEEINISSPLDSSVELNTHLDWFELEGEITYEKGTVEIRNVLEAVREGRKYVRVSEDTCGEISNELRNSLSNLSGVARVKNNAVRLPAAATADVDTMLDHVEESKMDDTIRSYRELYQSFDGIEPVREPDSFRGTLREYQRAGLAWLQFLREYGLGGLLADDMGLGKTIQVLAHLHHVEVTEGTFPDVLVICPRSVLNNWKREAERFLPDPDLYVHHGPNRKKRIEDGPDGHLMLTTYGTMRSDIETIRERTLDTIILDECQAIRNPDTKTARAARLLETEHRLGLSGTPVQNTVLDLWAQFQFLNPGLLGDRPYFEDHFVTPIEEKGKEEPSRRLRRLIKPFLLRRTKDQVEKQLPDLSESIVDCPFQVGQKEIYDEYRRRYQKEIYDAIRRQGVNQSRFKVLEGLTRLRQICCHPSLVEEEQENVENPRTSTKVIQFLERAEDLIEEGHRVLVFSQFVSFLSILRRVTREKEWTHEYLDGRTRNRQERVRRFQEDESISLFFISLKAGGEGLNLTGADYVFLMDPWWNPAVEQQAMDRTHRIGQENPVFVYRFICPNTIEEKMLDLQQRKEDIAQNIVTPEAGIFKDMDRDEILNLFEDDRAS